MNVSRNMRLRLRLHFALKRKRAALQLAVVVPGRALALTTPLRVLKGDRETERQRDRFVLRVPLRVPRPHAATLQAIVSKGHNTCISLVLSAMRIHAAA